MRIQKFLYGLSAKIMIKYIHEKEKTRFFGFCNHCGCIIT